MSDQPAPIRPAISAEGWRRRTVTHGDGAPGITPDETSWDDESVIVTNFGDMGGASIPAWRAPEVIAALNDIMPDSDHRKITQGMIDQLRWAATHAGESSGGAESAIEAIADILASYVRPPENEAK